MSLQNIQNKLGINQDGIFGPITARNIKKFLQLSDEEAAHFIGQCHHESGGFRFFEENLNYSEQALLRVFPRYFDTEEQVTINGKVIRRKAADYARQPEKIANWVYANRMGNGDEESGDGWKHRGFGLIQLTGKNNQYEFADWIKDQRIKENPSLITTNYALTSAKFYFEENNVWRFCQKVDQDSILAVSRFVNLGNPRSSVIPNGLKDREIQTNRVYNWLRNV